MLVRKNMYAVIFGMSGALYATPKDYSACLDFGSQDSLLCNRRSPAASYYHNDHMTQFHITDHLSTQEFPGYLYAAQPNKECTEAKGVWHYFWNALRQKTVGIDYGEYARDTNEAGDCERIAQGHARALQYIEKAVLPRDIVSYNASDFLQCMNDVRAEYLDTQDMCYRENQLMSWNSKIVIHKGLDEVSSALLYLQHDGIGQKDTHAWNLFWHNVRKRGKGSISIPNIEFERCLWGEQGRGDIINALLDRVVFITPSNSHLHAAVTSALTLVQSLVRHDPVAAAAQLYRSLVKISPFKGYNQKTAFMLMNALLLQRQYVPLPFLYEPELSSMAPYASLETFTAYFRIISDRVCMDLEMGNLDLEHGYSEKALAIMRGLNGVP